MTLSGPDALKAIEEALRDIRREESELTRKLSRGTELSTKLREQESELVRQLAAARLGVDAQASLALELDEASRRARQAIRARADALNAAEAALQPLDEAIGRADADRAALQLEAARRHAELSAARAAIRPALGRDAGYTARVAIARQLETMAEEARRKTTQAEADREQKGRPYRDDPLFMYLWERGYGTPDYKANPVLRFFDRRVAALLRFDAARANFAMLNDIPVRLRQHAERQQQLAWDAADELAVAEARALEAGGGRAAREALESVVDQIDALDRALADLASRRDAAIEAQRELAQGDAPAFAEAIAALGTILKRDELHALMAPAGEADERDGGVARQIVELRQRVRDEAEEARQQRVRLRTLAGRRRDLETLTRDLKAEGYDNPRSNFAETALASEQLDAFLRGDIKLPAYWDAWRQSQSWASPAGGTAAPWSRWSASGWQPAGPDGSHPAPDQGGPGGGWGLLSGVAGTPEPEAPTARATA